MRSEDESKKILLSFVGRWENLKTLKLGVEEILRNRTEKAELKDLKKLGLEYTQYDHQINQSIWYYFKKKKSWQFLVLKLATKENQKYSYLLCRKQEEERKEEKRRKGKKEGEEKLVSSTNLPSWFQGKEKSLCFFSLHFLFLGSQVNYYVLSCVCGIYYEKGCLFSSVSDRLFDSCGIWQLKIKYLNK